MPAVVIRQRKPWRRRDGVYLYFEGKNEKNKKTNLLTVFLNDQH